LNYKIFLEGLGDRQMVCVARWDLMVYWLNLGRIWRSGVWLKDSFRVLVYLD